MLPTEKSDSKKSVPNEELKGYKILLVEDTEDARQVISRILTKAGASVFSASNVPEARELLKGFQPDVIISDIGMPDEDGISFIRALRDDERFEGKHIPAIALTAYIASTHKHLTLKAGFEAHLCKPVPANALINSVLEVINDSRSPLH